MSREKIYGGIGERIGSRLRALGYYKGDRPDVLRFCRDKRYNSASVYAWLKGRVPEQYRDRLAEDLDTTTRWLLHGDDQPQPVPSMAEPTLPVPSSALHPELNNGIREHLEHQVQLFATLMAKVDEMARDIAALKEQGGAWPSDRAPTAMVQPASGQKKKRPLQKRRAAG